MKYKISTLTRSGTRHLIMQGNKGVRSKILCGITADVEPKQKFEGPEQHPDLNICGGCVEVYLQGDTHRNIRTNTKGFMP